MRRKALSTSPDGDGAAGSLLQPAPGQHTGDDERDCSHPHQPNPKFPPTPEPQRGRRGKKRSHRVRQAPEPPLHVLPAPCKVTVAGAHSALLGWTLCPPGCGTPPTRQNQASLQTLLHPEIHGGHGTCSFPHPEPQWHPRGHGDPLPLVPLSHPWDRAALGGRKGPVLPRIMKSVWVEVAAPAAFPNPPGARAGCQPQHGQPRPPPETPRTRLFTAALGAGGPRPELGAQVHTRSTPPPSTTLDLRGQNSPVPHFASFLPPSKRGFGGRSIAPQLLLPGTSPGRMGGTRPPGEIRGGRGSTGGHRGAIRGQGALPAAAALPHKGLGDGRLRTGSISAAEVSPPPPSPATAGGHKPRPEAARAGAGVTAMRGRVGGTPAPLSGSETEQRTPQPTGRKRLGRGGSESSGTTGTPPRTPR